MCLYRSNYYTACRCYVLLNLRSPAHRCQGPRDSRGVCPVQNHHPLEVTSVERLCGRCDRIRIEKGKIWKLTNETLPAAEAAGQKANYVKFMGDLAEAHEKLSKAIASGPYN
ncbi:hypothetical protein TWF569_005220 [Orbilia oligospora]|uniref:Uncharacterized protein n=1 Tax=Orbilia oligospora TaxID=2813651 RepID=A0A7C8NST0_ORBOL|nr:hypothetical protein TWF102_003587 [Orbilia oligospora]KAF3090714.1 hypothetical protein TWF706_009847 [Orbilia oligospora]KAF3111194.1 hypothetical protein TWF103_003872 [Orbilia oligospora]KAF3126375.1 hypothetical protein TWF703_010458 [Orbilia oligospora]KAF3136271.1 hypothetical protein TWF594_007912 [Orbilia oligospora]